MASHPIQHIRQKLHDSLEREACEVVTLKQRRTVEHASGQHTQVDTSEGIGLASVAADGKELWVLGGGGEQVGKEERDSVLVADGALVPVLRDLLVALGPLEVAAIAGDGEEGLQDLLVKAALGVLGRLVGHEAVYERVGCGLNRNTGERSVEEVWVVVNRLLEAGCAEGG